MLVLLLIVRIYKQFLKSARAVNYTDISLGDNTALRLEAIHCR